MGPVLLLTRIKVHNSLAGVVCAWKNSKFSQFKIPIKQWHCYKAVSLNLVIVRITNFRHYSTPPMFPSKQACSQNSFCIFQVVNRECFSKIICEECYKNVNRLFKFRKMIIDSDIKIRSFARKRIRQNKHDDSKLTTPILRQQVVKTLEKENNCTEEKPSQNEEELDEKYERISPKEGSADLSSPPKKETQIRKHICNICGKIIRTDNLSRHIQNHSENPVSCSLCGKTLKNRNSLRVHLVTLHNDASFTCDSCGKSFKYKKSLSQHMQKNHGK